MIRRRCLRALDFFPGCFPKTTITYADATAKSFARIAATVDDPAPGDDQIRDRIAALAS
jgi:hypothetical protein